jgi:hypothetical protein
MELFDLELVQQHFVGTRPGVLGRDLGIDRGMTGFEAIDPAFVAHTQSSNAKCASGCARHSRGKHGTRLRINRNPIAGGKAMRNSAAAGGMTW